MTARQAVILKDGWMRRSAEGKTKKIAMSAAIKMTLIGGVRKTTSGLPEAKTESRSIFLKTARALSAHARARSP